MHYQSVKIRMMLHRPWPGSKSHIEEPKNFFFSGVMLHVLEICLRPQTPVGPVAVTCALILNIHQSIGSLRTSNAARLRISASVRPPGRNVWVMSWQMLVPVSKRSGDVRGSC